MAKVQGLIVKITADPPIGGDYHLEPRGDIFFTNREFHLIKVETGLRPAEIDEAFAKLDPDSLVAFALVALQRAGFDRPEARQVVWDLPPGNITVEPEVVEDDQPLPPEKPLDEPVSPSAID